MTKTAIEIKGLVKRFHNFQLGPLNLSIPKGTIVGYIGQNGAGKSTTIKLLLGLLHKDAGEIRILDEDNPNSVRLKDRLGVVFDDLFVPEEMTLVDLEKFCRRVYSNWERDLFYSFIERFKLPAKKIIKNYSRGMKMKLSMAVALSHNAEVLILDEATSGLDPIVREEILDLLLEFMQDEEHTILISSHILSDLEKVADYIAFIHDGRVLFVEAKDDLKENYGLCTLSNEEVKDIDEDAIVGRRVHSFGQELLLKKNLVPAGLKLEKPSIEDIMIYFIKGVESK
ncbi:MAG: ABC transporter ATP-binding protein [Eubacteriales bacterium]|nr:ABC transporter ATP-binding protein [Eubacteriales bacterium]